ncbi:hypothetical protein MSAN_02207900 [Mycena sanguinolenta]|uniref:Uncharacterized protein n=1 Tax=Mycena sanguinolenta TaxID=230812 RepID=A0A8H6XCK7_9AGAR|nr:hypothetical protein MSAN_02207900 [Mycena sanguinolenta]
MRALLSAKSQDWRVNGYMRTLNFMQAFQPHKPIENSTYLSLMQEQDDSPGLKEDNPMVLVQPERRPRVYNRPVEAILAYTADEGFQLAVGSRGASDGVLVQKAFFCKLDKRWNFRSSLWDLSYCS